MSPASPEDRPVEAAPRRRLLLVSLGEEVAGLRAESVVEVITARPYAPIPGTAECIAGLVNRRGRVLTVLDLGLALDSSSTSAVPDHRIVVVSFLAKELGIAVGDVLRIIDDSADDSQLRVVELDVLLTPFFGDDGSRFEEPTLERP
jgi:purine-binding chemotaxis protein CheW